MKWEKKGLICSSESFNLPWYVKNTMVPVAYLVDDNTLRIFLTMCDEKNIGRIGYIDVNPENPKDIVDFSKEPVLDIGKEGAFDDNGVITASAVVNDDELWLYYSGYQLGVKVPYYIFSGLAISKDKGITAKRYSDAPVLDRKNNDLFLASGGHIIKDNDLYKMWYIGTVGKGWVSGDDGNKMPLYTMKYVESKDGKNWNTNEGIECLHFANEDEHGFGRPCVYKEDNKYKMIYSIRTLSKGYRLGYAESDNGIDFDRMDDKIGIDVSESGWDSEMICFGNRFEYKDKTYLFYCGNHYGMAGFGYAELVER